MVETCDNGLLESRSLPYLVGDVLEAAAVVTVLCFGDAITVRCVREMPGNCLNSNTCSLKSTHGFHEPGGCQWTMVSQAGNATLTRPVALYSRDLKSRIINSKVKCSIQLCMTALRTPIPLSAHHSHPTIPEHQPPQHVHHVYAQIQAQA